MDRGFTELIAKDVRTRSELEYLRGAGSRDSAEFWADHNRETEHKMDVQKAVV